MKMPTFFRYGVGIVAVAALLAGCSNGGSSSSAASGLASSGFNPAGAVAPRWIDPAIASARRDMTPAKVAEAGADGETQRLRPVRRREIVDIDPVGRRRHRAA